jgi:hypothetical protein
MKPGQVIEALVPGCHWCSALSKWVNFDVGDVAIVVRLKDVGYGELRAVYDILLLRKGVEVGINASYIHNKERWRLTDDRETQP